MTSATLAPRRHRLHTPALILGFVAAVVLRVLIGGTEVAESAGAGLAFAAALTALTVAARPRLRITATGLLAGAGGGAVLCLPALVGQLSGAAVPPPAGSYPRWALVVGVVAVAEEAFLRGALFDALAGRSGQGAAIAVPALAFALLHVPLYGWHVLPLDLAVGCWLGALRAATGSFVAPAVAHAVADWAGWWLR